MDSFLAYATGMPLGAITAYATNGVPAGWLLCDGQAVSRTAYAALFTAIGTIYGAGDGTTTFNVPDLRNEFIRGLGTQTLGVHNPASLAAHGHGITDTGHTHPLGGHTHAFVTGTANEVAGQSHAHGVNDAGHSHGYTTLTSGTGTAAGSGVAQTASTNTTTNDTGISIQSTSTNHTHSGTTAAPTVDSSANITGITVQNSTGAETVPQNVAMHYIIKAIDDAASGGGNVIPATQVSFTQVGTGAVASTAQKKLQESVSVKDFGAVGDGITDDTAAIQAAVTAASIANARGTVLFPAGTYKVKTTAVDVGAINILSGLTLIGYGATIVVDATSGLKTRTIDVQASGVTIVGMRFTPATIQDLTNIHLSDGFNDLTVTGCEFVNPQSGGLYIDGLSNRVSFTENKVTGRGYGILDNSAAGGGGFVFSDNIFIGSGSTDGDAIGINATIMPVKDVVISGNTASNYIGANASSGFGIALSTCEGVSITGNTLNGFTRNGIHVETSSKDVTITGNTVFDCGEAGIEIQGEVSGKQCERVVISGNVVRNCCTAPFSGLGRGGIDCGSNTTGIGYGVYSLVVSGNIVTENQTAGIYAYQCEAAIISGNKVLNSNGPGIKLITPIDSVVQGNICTDDQTPKTQTYGLQIEGGVAGANGTQFQVIGNMLSGNLTWGLNDLTTGGCYLGNTGAWDFQSVAFSGGARKLGFFGLQTPLDKPTVTGAKAGNAAIASLLSQLAALGLITDSST